MRARIEKIAKAFDVNQAQRDNIDSNDGSFTILTDEILETTIDSITTYTLRIETPTDSTASFENFVIKPTDSINFFSIFKYYYDAQSEDDFPYTIATTPVDNSLIDALLLDDITRQYVTVDDCTYEIICVMNPGTWECDYVAELICCNCSESGTSGSNGSDDDDNDGNTGSDPDNNDNNGDYPLGSTGTGLSNGAIGILDTPEALPLTNCESLDELTDENKQNISVAIDFLKDKLATHATNEWGTSLSRKRDYSNAEGDDDFALIYDSATEEGSPNDTSYWVGGYFYAGIHTHTENGTSIFSWGDVKELNNIYINALNYNKQHVTNIVICTNPEDHNNPFIYALKIDDIASLKSSILDVLNDPEYDGLTDKEKTKEILIDEESYHDANKDNLERAFLRKFSNYGISLYKANDDLSNWNKLTMDIDGTTVHSSACNQ